MPAQKRQTALERRVEQLEIQSTEHSRQLAATSTTLGRVSEDVNAALTLNQSNSALLSENTSLTRQLSDKFDAFERRASPGVELTERMYKGAAVVGAIADWAQRWGGRGLKLALWCAACVAAFKVFTGGGGWAEAVRVFGEVQGK